MGCTAASDKGDRCSRGYDDQGTGQDEEWCLQDHADKGATHQDFRSLSIRRSEVSGPDEGNLQGDIRCGGISSRGNIASILEPDRRNPFWMVLQKSMAQVLFLRGGAAIPVRAGSVDLLLRPERYLGNIVARTSSNGCGIRRYGGETARGSGTSSSAQARLPPPRRQPAGELRRPPQPRQPRRSRLSSFPGTSLKSSKGDTPGSLGRLQKSQLFVDLSVSRSDCPQTTSITTCRTSPASQSRTSSELRNEVGRRISREYQTWMSRPHAGEELAIQPQRLTYESGQYPLSYCRIQLEHAPAVLDLQFV